MSEPDTSGGAVVSTRSTTKVNTSHCDRPVAPSDVESVDVEEVENAPSGGAELSVSDDERVEHLPPATRKSLQEEANRLYHLFIHKPKKPYCEACWRPKMKEKRKHAGSYRNTSTRWGKIVAGDHMVSTKDNMIGFDGNRVILVIKDAFSNFKSAYPMPDKSVDSTMDAIKHVKGERNIERFYSDRFGEIDGAL